NDFPGPDEHLASTRTKGAPYAMMSKLRIFDPDAIEESDFAIGGHGAAPRGRLRLPWRDELLLLHYKFLGIAYIRARSRELHGILPDWDRAQSWAETATQPRVDHAWRQFVDGLVDLSDPAHVPWIDHFLPRWWRGRYDPSWIARGIVKRTRE